MPELSHHLRGRHPSPIRTAQIIALQRPDRDELVIVNLAIGNVSLPAHPALTERLEALGRGDSPFAGGVVKYTPTVGLDETRRAFLNVIASAGADVSGLEVLVTDGGSMAMELMLLGVCGPSSSRPLLMLDPSYSNYADMARRIGARTVAATRRLGPDGSYGLPSVPELEALIERERPTGLLVIPADNPTGQFLDRARLIELARLAVKHDLWLISDEAYRQLNYAGQAPSSVWSLTEQEVPGLRGRRIGIETVSKVFNACGLRIGALVTDHPELHQRTVAEYTANLCANAVGQWVFGALAHLSHEQLAGWYEQQRTYYRGLLEDTTRALTEAVPGLLVSSPQASLYSVLDLSGVHGGRGVDAAGFVRYCAERGRVEHEGRPHTLLLAPMTGFQAGAPDPAAQQQLRLAYVEPPEVLQKVPRLLAALLEAYVRQ